MTWGCDLEREAKAEVWWIRALQNQYRISSDREELPTARDTAPGCTIADEPGCRCHDEGVSLLKERRVKFRRQLFEGVRQKGNTAGGLNVKKQMDV